MITPPTHVQHIMSTLSAAGYDAYLVGGCVRDHLLGRTPHDYDIATNARPHQVMALFERVVPTGEKYGTVTVLVDHEPVEVTTYRRDGVYSDGRRPDSVEFGESIEEDLARRDFTINAMAWNHRRGLVDPWGGYDDLCDKTIRVVGSVERLKEDALRMLRAARFMATLGFSITTKTMMGMIDNAPLLKNVSPERIREELNRILLGEHCQWGLHVLSATHLLDQFLPELVDCIGFDQHNPHHGKPVYDHILAVVEGLPPVLHLRLAGLLHDIAKPRTFTMGEDGVGHFYGHEGVGAEMAGEILRRLKYDNATIDKVTFLVREHMWPGTMGRRGMRRFVARVGEHLDDLLLLREADVKAGKTPSRLEYLDDVRRVRDEMASEGLSNPATALAINGHDVMAALGLKPSPRVGKVLAALTERVIDEPALNQRETLLGMLREVAD